MPTSSATPAASSDVTDTTQKCSSGAASTGSRSGEENNSQNVRNASSEPTMGPTRTRMFLTGSSMAYRLLRDDEGVHAVWPAKLAGASGARLGTLGSLFTAAVRTFNKDRHTGDARLPRKA